MTKVNSTASHPEAEGGPGLSREGLPDGNGIWSSGGGRTNGDRALPDRHSDHGAVGSFEATLSGKITTVNSALARMLGHASRQDLVGSCISELLAEPATFDRVLGHGRQGQGLRGVEVPLRTKQGEEVVVLLLCTRLLKSNGTSGHRVVGTLVDVTERTRREFDVADSAIREQQNGVASHRIFDRHAPKYLAAAVRRGTLLWGNPSST